MTLISESEDRLIQGGGLIAVGVDPCATPGEGLGPADAAFVWWISISGADDRGDLDGLGRRGAGDGKVVAYATSLDGSSELLGNIRPPCSESLEPQL